MESVYDAGPVMPKLRCLSLGAGVQSTTMALMAAVGEITPMPDCAIFADTAWEPTEVYDHLARLEKELPFPVYRVTGGSIRQSIRRQSAGEKGRFASVPWWTVGRDGRPALGRRQCTKEYKLVPIARKQRALLGYKPRQRIPVGSVEVWIGISTDEFMRMKPAWNRWQVNRWPLIDLGMSRTSCIEWLGRHGWTAPKSACLGCPFHSNAEWRRIRDTQPREWQELLKMDKMIRDGGSSRGLRGQQFMHRTLQALGDVDLRTDEQKGQGMLFNNECEGMCGV